MQPFLNQIPLSNQNFLHVYLRFSAIEEKRVVGVHFINNKINIFYTYFIKKIKFGNIFKLF